MEKAVLIAVIVGGLFLLAIMAGVIIVIRATREKKNLLQRLIHYTGIGILCIVGITLLPLLLPLLLNFIGELIIIGIIIIAVIRLKRRNNS